MRHDHERLCREPLDEFAAFDFFMAAGHLTQWFEKDVERPQVRSPLTTWRWAERVCNDIANRAKHFSTNRDAVAAVRRKRGFCPKGFSDGFARAGLIIELAGAKQRQAAVTAGLRLIPRGRGEAPCHMQVLKFQEWVLALWEGWYAAADAARDAQHLIEQ